MELKKSIDARKIVALAYLILMSIYLAIGFTPAPVEAVNYDIATEILIPSISLASDVTALKLRDGNLDTPNTIVGSFSYAKNKTFLVGHSSTVFQNLHEVKVGDEIIYDYTTFIVKKMEVLERAEISMTELLREAEVETLVVMTCAGENLPGGDATHRLIITAEVQ
ncbi:class F sortase [Candidatus Saccharibacteria bacterium]|nr:class F sortase [Candidatus Saccharibacteria bacterium]